MEYLRKKRSPSPSPKTEKKRPRSPSPSPSPKTEKKRPRSPSSKRENRSPSPSRFPPLSIYQVHTLYEQLTINDILKIFVGLFYNLRINSVLFLIHYMNYRFREDYQILSKGLLDEDKQRLSEGLYDDKLSSYIYLYLKKGERLSRENVINLSKTINFAKNIDFTKIYGFSKKEIAELKVDIENILKVINIILIEIMYFALKDKDFDLVKMITENSPQTLVSTIKVFNIKPDIWQEVRDYRNNAHIVRRIEHGVWQELMYYALDIGSAHIIRILRDNYTDRLDETRSYYY